MRWRMVINLFFGTLINRFGTKKLIGAGFICLKYGSYNPGFIFCAFLMLGVIIDMQFLISAAHRYQKE